MPLKAAFFDVGDTLVEHWAPRDVVNGVARAQVRAALGEPEWLEELLDARLEPRPAVSFARALAGRRGETSRFEPQDTRQETTEWYRAWFASRGVEARGVDLDQLRALMCVPLAEISSPVAGAFEALRWCAERDLRVVLVTNTLARGDAEALADWRRFGLADAIHGIVSSHSAGWRKPHPAIFEKALALAGARPEETVHVGDNLIADVWGAQQVGIRAIWRRSTRVRPPTGERGSPPDPWADLTPREPGTCEHPAEALAAGDELVRCVSCGGDAGIEVRPDAVIDDLTVLPKLLERWRA